LGHGVRFWEEGGAVDLRKFPQATKISL